MKKTLTLFLSICSLASVAQDYSLLGTDVSGDCISACPDIKEIHYDFDIAQDSAWFRIVTFNARQPNDGIYIHIDWDDNETNGDDWTGGSFSLDFYQNRQINLMFSGAGWHWIEEFEEGSGGWPVGGTVNVTEVDEYTTDVNVLLSDIDENADGAFKYAASVGNAAYGIFDLLPDNGYDYSVSPADLEEVISAELTIYPNPASDEVVVESAKLEGNQIILLNTLGEVVLSTKAGSNKVNFDLRKLHAGVYFVQFDSGTTVETKRLVIQ